MVTISNLVRYDTILQNAIVDIVTKFDSYLITKCDKCVLQNASFIFVTKFDSFITECENYYKMRKF